MNAIDFGKFLATLRNEKKLTQEELAEKLFIDKRKVSRWECGMSIPDFETLIKLSEILDVSLYELSICKKLKKDKLRIKAIKKFRSIKDFKKYKFKKKLQIILAIIIGIFFILTLIYTIKYYGTVQIYEFRSLDEKYILEGTYVHTNNYDMYSINKLHFNDTKKIIINNQPYCNFSIYKNETRIIHIEPENRYENNNCINYSRSYYYGKSLNDNLDNIPLVLEAICGDDKNKETYLINFEFIKKYDNKLF